MQDTKDHLTFERKIFWKGYLDRWPRHTLRLKKYMNCREPDLIHEIKANSEKQEWWNAKARVGREQAVKKNIFEKWRDNIRKDLQILGVADWENASGSY